jgi:hypothetical protein
MKSLPCYSIHHDRHLSNQLAQKTHSAAAQGYCSSVDMQHRGKRRMYDAAGGTTCTTSTRVILVLHHSSKVVKQKASTVCEVILVSLLPNNMCVQMNQNRATATVTLTRSSSTITGILETSIFSLG